jgi:hypothetical protein
MILKKMLLMLTVSISLNSILFAATRQIEEFFYNPPERLNLINSLQYGAAADGTQDLVLSRGLSAYPERIRRTVQINCTLNKGIFKTNRLCIKNSVSEYSHILAAAHLTISMYEDFINNDTWTLLTLERTSGNINQTAFHPNELKVKLYGKSLNDVDFDVVAHEVGHAVLHHLNPRLNNTYNSNYVNFQTRALHEAFADSTALFASLIFLENGFTTETISILSNKNNFSALAPKFAGDMFGLRNTKDQTHYGIYYKEGSFHNFSLIITNLIQEIMYEVVSHAVFNDSTRSGEAIINTRFASKLLVPVVKAFRDATINDDLLSNFGNSLLCELNKVYHDKELKSSINRLIIEYNLSLSKNLIKPQPILATQPSLRRKTKGANQTGPTNESSFWDNVCTIS